MGKTNREMLDRSTESKIIRLRKEVKGMLSGGEARQSNWTWPRKRWLKVIKEDLRLVRMNQERIGRE